MAKEKDKPKPSKVSRDTRTGKFVIKEHSAKKGDKSSGKVRKGGGTDLTGPRDKD
jgi:hypothetical protein